ncbi:MAG: phosphate signaling complex protein PhoU [Actinomycetia bacterium]|jgi:phosphate transport system protein|nr:phosphate signaling complex protein PhoU [Actinomycetes bacterium]
MRDVYHEMLDELTDELVEMSRLVGSMMQRASVALLEADRVVAEAVIADDEAVDAVNNEIDHRTAEILALQQPVASDLRMVIVAMRLGATLERMGDLAQHIAKTARMRYPDNAVPEELRPQFTQMAAVANRMAARMGEVIASKDVEQARQLENEDDQMDALHRQVLDHLLAHPEGAVNETVDITLLNRYYERFADHAVSVARRIIYLVIGERTDA